MDTIEREQGDTGPPIDDTLESDNTADNLTGATVAFSLWKYGADAKIVDENTSNVTIEDASNGEVEYDFQAGDLSDSGLHYYEWTVTFADGTEVTYPNTSDDGVELWVNEGSP